jgi:hypothetical protein
VRAGVFEQQQAISVEPPAAARELRAVVGAGTGLDQGSVAAQVEAAPPARRRQRMIAGPIDPLVAAVLLVRVDPAPAELGGAGPVRQGGL